MRHTPYTGRKTDFYVAPEGVAEIVELAVELQRPLLVEGEAGCGKTQLAASVAAEKRLSLVKIAVKSTATARDLLWRFDALRRLQDAQDKENKQARYIYPYISLGPLGAALNRSSSEGPCVVLLDEVDKADIDFPNDLLDVLDTFEFQIEDLPPSEEKDCLHENGFGREMQSEKDARPIVIITSNREKRLPEAFLRRCLYVRLHFPRDATTLAEIVRKNTKLGHQALGDEIVDAAVRRFITVRDSALELDVQKAPSTSELIDWVRILHLRKETPDSIAKSEFPPYWETLFKTFQDLDTFKAGASKDT